MYKVTWETLTIPQRIALETFKDGKRCFDFKSEAIGTLAYCGYFKLVRDEISEISWYEITDAGRELLAQAAEDTATEATAGERETYLRNDLFKRVKDTLELTLAYLPGELAEFPEKVQTVVSDFSNYCNIAEKQIQEREAELATARKQVAELTAELKASGDEYKRLIHEMNHWGYES